MPHSEPNRKQKKCPPRSIHTAAVCVASRNFFFMTSHLYSHKTTDVKPEMLSGVQTGNGTPHDKYIIRGIAHVRTKRKDNFFMQRRLVQNFTFILEWGQRTCSLTKHTWRWTYSECCLVRFAAFLGIKQLFKINFGPKLNQHQNELGI